MNSRGRCGLAVVLGLSLGCAQGALQPGDVQCIAFQAHGSKDFAFVVWTNLAATDVFCVTDNGVFEGALRAGEGTFTYTPPAGGLPAGTVVLVTNAAAVLTDVPGFGVNTGSVTRAGAFNFASAGDQLIVYQAMPGATTFLYAVSTDGTGWSSANSANATALPPGLVDGHSAIHVERHLLYANNAVSGAYVGPRWGTRSELAQALRSPCQWELGDYPVAPSAAPFRVWPEPRTLAFQGFEGGPEDTWMLTAGAGWVAADPGVDDVNPAGQRVRTGAASWQASNTTATLELRSIHTLTHTGLVLAVQVSATSTGAANGMDAGDFLQVRVACNGHPFSPAPDIELRGNADARWGYTAAAVSTRAGAPVVATPAGGGRRDSVGDGASCLRIAIPDGTANVRVRIAARSNAAEIWNVDDIRLTGLPGPRGAVLLAY